MSSSAALVLAIRRECKCTGGDYCRRAQWHTRRLFCNGSPPIVAYLLKTSEDNNSYMAEVQMYLAITNLFGTIIRMFTGIITLSVTYFWRAGLLALDIGMILGRVIFKYIDSKRLKLLIYGLMLISDMINLL